MAQNDWWGQQPPPGGGYGAFNGRYGYGRPGSGSLGMTAVPGVGAANGVMGAVMGGIGRPTAGNQIADMYRQVSGGTYAPSQQDIAQFGPNPDAAYLQKIGPQIQQWWDANKASNPTGAQPGQQLQRGDFESMDHWRARQQQLPYNPSSGGYTPLSQLGGGGYPSGVPDNTDIRGRMAADWRRSPYGVGAPGGMPGGGGGDFVQMRSPTGQMGRVHRSRLQDAIAAGGTVVG